MMVMSPMMRTPVYVSDDYYEHMLDNTLVHIHNQSCGFTMSICMTCRNMIMPKSLKLSMGKKLENVETQFRQSHSYESFFFVMCANCRMEVQRNTGRIPSRGKQRNMIEAIIKEPSSNKEAHQCKTMNPNEYTNIYVLSIENGVEIILIFGQMPV